MTLRLDEALVERGLVPTRSAARRAIDDGTVLVDGKPATKPALKTTTQARIELTARQHVSRAARKLLAALDFFEVDVARCRALDAGASTGGFTEVLLERGASAVVAVDVGHDQMTTRLRVDPRVTLLEGTNVRHLTAAEVGGPIEVLVADLSFISLTKVVDGLAPHLAPSADVVLLVKPQYEVGPAHVGRGGLVRSGSAHRRAIAGVLASWMEAGWHARAGMVSPILGGDGNTEFLVHLRAEQGADVDRLLDDLCGAEGAR